MNNYYNNAVHGPRGRDRDTAKPFPGNPLMRTRSVRYIPAVKGERAVSTIDAVQTTCASDEMLYEHGATVELVHRMIDTSQSLSDSRLQYWSRPLKRVSADFFCTAEHPKLGWVGLFADAAGHGLSAAIFALHLPLLFREAVHLGVSLPGIYLRLNRFLLRQHVEDHFICGALVRVCGSNIEVLNAGMPDVHLLAEDGRPVVAFSSQCMPLGITQNENTQEIQPQGYRLGRGERAVMLIHSDGLSDLGILRGPPLGADGILAAARCGVGDVFERLVQEATRREVDAHDDMSLLVFPVPFVVPMASASSEHPGSSACDTDIAAPLVHMVDILDLGVVLTDTDEHILYVNPAFTAMTGYTRDEALGQSPRLWSSGRHDAAFYRGIWREVADTGHWCGELLNRRKDGELDLHWTVLRALKDDKGRVAHYVATYWPIDQKKALEQGSGYQALFDPLTRLPNRVLLNDRGLRALCRAQRSGCPVAVVTINLDRFQALNDGYGHEVGDAILREVSRRFADTLRSDDTIARYGSDEFVCLLSGFADRHDPAKVVRKLLAALESPMEVAGHSFKVGASIGVSTSVEDKGNFDDLLSQSGRAMRHAKQAGGNMALFFSPEMNDVVARQLDLETRLHAAIDAGELAVFLQPKVALDTGRIVGAEALVRWRDPRDGLVAPSVFIPVAEKSDLIARIGQWMLERVCWLLAARHDDLPADFHIAVNVSPMQFERGDVASDVARILRETGAASSRLQIEVTESTFIRNTEGVGEMLKRIVALGVSMALDDFGTGYSNLASLSRLPIDTFKLDQSFVRNVHADPGNSAIARSVRHLATGLAKKVVAEGVETHAECLHLAEIGYGIGQGYLFGKPMPAADFFAFLDNWQPYPCADAEFVCTNTAAPGLEACH